MCAEISLTNHAKAKMEERGISLALIEETISNPEQIISDSLDDVIIHLIRKIGSKYLRVLLREENNKCVIITLFFDRRLKGVENDKSQL